MDCGEAPQTGVGATHSGQTVPVTTVPFEVVRRAEFVFEPFVGSLIQLPEAAAQQGQSSEFFLPQSPLPPLLAGETKSPTGVAESDVSEQPEQMEQRTSTQLSPELKAVILRIDEQRRLRYERKDPSNRDKPRLPNPELEKNAEVQAAERMARWEEIAAPEATEKEQTADRTLHIAEPVSEVAGVEETQRANLNPAPVETVFAHTPIAEGSAIGEEKQRGKKKEKLSLATRLRRWLGGEAPALVGSRRRAERVIMPGLVAFYWSGGTPRPHEIVNVSKTGFYMRTTELWAVETLVRMTLQQPASRAKTVSVLARVVRIDEGGVGHEFVTTEALMAARSLDVMPSEGTDWRELDIFLGGE